MDPDYVRSKHNALAEQYNKGLVAWYGLLMQLREDWKKMTGKIELEGFTGLQHNVEMQDAMPMGSGGEGEKV